MPQLGASSVTLLRTPLMYGYGPGGQRHRPLLSVGTDVEPVVVVRVDDLAPPSDSITQCTAVESRVPQNCRDIEASDA